VALARVALAKCTSQVHEKQQPVSQTVAGEATLLPVARRQPFLAIRSPGAGFANEIALIVLTGELAS
jgi:hypothetical protein